MNRRQFLSASAVTALGLFPAGRVLAQSFWDYPRSLWLKRPATGEEKRLVYWAQGQYLVDGYREACHMLRDVQANQTVAMDPVLLDILRGMQGWFEAAGISKPIILNSGYRSPNTNKKIEGAARNSQHLSGRRQTLLFRTFRTIWQSWPCTFRAAVSASIHPRDSYTHWTPETYVSGRVEMKGNKPVLAATNAIVDLHDFNTTRNTRCPTDFSQQTRWVSPSLR